ncbi:mitochondrial amidoxime-reducing component 1-like [Sitodiplosis mosellana]|uniref:mitochondrial amidoxime-reducing component 1-like n=1 Tax=Sitodiplosis mosellana TaxID=263140 RepID=UPI0024447AB5|nr:mitochondrial amidoxime-reducing component 1-like [Sitodiplosis mosellana]
MADNQTKIIVGTAIALTTTAVGVAAYLYQRNAPESIPTKWKKVGQLSELYCYPVKSCGAIKRDSFDCHVLGLRCENLFDRCFAVSLNNKQISGRTYPKMWLIQPRVEGNQLILSAPNQSDLVINLDTLKDLPINNEIELWYCEVGGVDAGQEAADWLSNFIDEKLGSVRLIYYPHSYAAKVKPKIANKYKAYKDSDTGSYQEETSYLLINQASIDELNTNFDHVVVPLQFRPNLVVQGSTAYEEDNWKWIRIGENVIFRGLKRCPRCIFTTVNPETAERNPQLEPLRTLKKTRPSLDGMPYMGQNLAIRVPGTISIGDFVYINDDSEA